MPSELEQLDQTLNSTLTLPNGREVEVRSLPTKKAIAYLRQMAVIGEGGVQSLYAWADVIESLGEDLDITDELGELEAEETTEFIMDFFALLVRRVMVSKRNGSEPQRSSLSSSRPTEASGEGEISTGENS